MITVPDDVLLTAGDLAAALGCAERTAVDWIRENGGTRLCGTWCILGRAMKQALTPAGQVVPLRQDAGYTSRRRLA
jgi:hypothetical protein